MGYRSLRECVVDLERAGRLVRIRQEIDPHLEAAAIQRRVYQAGGPALYFERLKGCQFPALGNLFGTLDRTRFLFRDTIDTVRRMIELKIDPAMLAKNPWGYRSVPLAALNMLPKRVSTGPVMEGSTTIDQLPQIKSWPDDGGPFITLPQVYSEDVTRPGWKNSNLGMYRVQLSGGRYRSNEQIGLHYQIHRGIGVHHSKAIQSGQPFRVNIFIGGTPAMTLAAVMPLPEGMSELGFAGALAGHRIRLASQPNQLPFAADADFCISGTVDPKLLLPEGPFGDHLGYYSLAHDFPVLNVEQVRHRHDAIWLFTSVGRPPQEDTSFGEIIHELTGPIIPTVISGVKGVHAVDAAGVHPLLLAIGSERYVPYAERRQPQELLTCANAILGQGQLSLAKYLLIVAKEDLPDLDVHDIRGMFRAVLERIDWRRDLHFQTKTTIDTLDYSGEGFNSGSKVVLAAVGSPIRSLPNELPSGFTLPEGFRDPVIPLPGVLAISAPKYQSGFDPADREQSLKRFLREVKRDHPLNQFPLIVLVDDAPFVAPFATGALNNFLWVTFTRSNPATDLHGIEEFTENKHWGCCGSLVIDARTKPHHAPPLIDDPAITRFVDGLAAPGGPLHGIF